MKLWYALDLSCPPKWIDHSLGSISSSLVPPFSPLCRLLVHPPTSCLPLSCLRSLTREKAETLIRFRKQCLYLFNGLSVHEQTCQCLCSLLCMWDSSGGCNVNNATTWPRWVLNFECLPFLVCESTGLARKIQSKSNFYHQCPFQALKKTS